MSCTTCNDSKMVPASASAMVDGRDANGYESCPDCVPATNAELRRVGYDALRNAFGLCQYVADDRGRLSVGQLGWPQAATMVVDLSATQLSMTLHLSNGELWQLGTSTGGWVGSAFDTAESPLDFVQAAADFIGRHCSEARA